MEEIVAGFAALQKLVVEAAERRIAKGRPRGFGRRLGCGLRS